MAEGKPKDIMKRIPLPENHAKLLSFFIACVLSMHLSINLHSIFNTYLLPKTWTFHRLELMIFIIPPLVWGALHLLPYSLVRVDIGWCPQNSPSVVFMDPQDEGGVPVLGCRGIHTHTLSWGGAHSKP